MEKGRDLLFYEDRDSTSKQAVVEFDPRLIGTSNSGDQNPVMTSCVEDLSELSLLYGKNCKLVPMLYFPIPWRKETDFGIQNELHLRCDR